MNFSAIMPLLQKMCIRDSALCSTQSQIQGVLADHTNRGHSDLDTRTAIVTVEEDKICLLYTSISPDDLERSKNLVRYEIQLKRPSLKEFEHDKLESKSAKFQFGNHALFQYFDKISDDIPFFLRCV